MGRKMSPLQWFDDTNTMEIVSCKSGEFFWTTKEIAELIATFVPDLGERTCSLATWSQAHPIFCVIKHVSATWLWSSTNHHPLDIVVWALSVSPSPCNTVTCLFFQMLIENRLHSALVAAPTKCSVSKLGSEYIPRSISGNTMGFWCKQWSKVVWFLICRAFKENVWSALWMFQKTTRRVPGRRFSSNSPFYLPSSGSLPWHVLSLWSINLDKLFGPLWVLHTMQIETYHGRKRCTHVKCDLLCRNAIQFVSYENFLTFLSPGMHGSSPNVNWAMWIMCLPSLFLVHSPILSDNITDSLEMHLKT